MGDHLDSLEVPHLSLVLAANAYDKSEELQHAIHALKYLRKQSVVPALGAFLASATLRLPPLWRDAVLCPVPLHWTRRFSRGFNQAALLSRAVTHHTSIPTQDLLRRHRMTGRQVGRNRIERLEAMDGAFTCIAKEVPPTVLLVDDVITTGATMDACAAALKRAGVARVGGLVLALG